MFSVLLHLNGRFYCTNITDKSILFYSCLNGNTNSDKNML